MTTERTTAAWAGALAAIVDVAHLSTGEQLSALVDEAVQPLGLTAELYLVDLAQRVLTPVVPDPADGLSVEGSLAGRCYQHGEILATTGDDGHRALWIPVLDGTDRVGVLRLGLGDGVEDDTELRRWAWTLAGLAGHVLMTKIVYSDHLRRIRTNGPLSQAAELLWQLLPPRTFATDRVVVSAILEPHADVAGDAYDYNVEQDVVDLAVFDAVGHDLTAGITTALAITAVRNARRRHGECELRAVAEQVDELIAGRPGRVQFVTSVLARLDMRTGVLDYLLAGHPPPLLLRGDTVVKELDAPPRTPLGVVVPGLPPATVGREQLEPGDALLFYSDGIVEARDRHGEFFGEERLIELAEHASAGHLSAPETLRRLAASVLAHQGGVLQDDATLLVVEWSTTGHLRMFPSSAPPDS